MMPCRRTVHAGCMSPPLRRIPRNWRCAECCERQKREEEAARRAALADSVVDDDGDTDESDSENEAHAAGAAPVSGKEASAKLRFSVVHVDDPGGAAAPSQTRLTGRSDDAVTRARAHQRQRQIRWCGSAKSAALCLCPGETTSAAVTARRLPRLS